MKLELFDISLCIVVYCVYVMCINLRSWSLIAEREVGFMTVWSGNLG